MKVVANLQGAAGYVRVSQVGARGGDTFLSPELQRERIQAWAAYKQIPIVEWYTDLDVSGRAGVRRPAFERMMGDAGKRRFSIVVVYKLTRFGRSNRESATRFADLERLGVGLASATEDIDTTSATGGLVRNMLFALAEYESERIGEEWSSVHRNRRSRGLAHASHGVYGYECEGAVPTRIDAIEARAVRGAYQRRIDGATMGEVRRWLHDEGHRPRNGAEWWAQSTVSRLLRNPLYAGLVRVDGKLIDARHEAIVPRDVWDRVQRSHTTQAAPPRHTAGLCAGIVVCDSCGYRMQVMAARGMRHYRCASQKMQRACPALTQIAVHKLDAWVEHELLAALEPHRLQARNTNADQRARRVSTLERRSGEIQRAIDRLSDERYLLGSLDASEYERQARRLLDERSRVERELDAVSRPVEQKVVTLGPEAWAALTLAQRQRLARAVIRQVRVKPSTRGGARWVKAESRAAIDWL